MAGIVLAQTCPFSSRRRVGREQLQSFRSFRSEHGSGQGQNLALTVLYVPRFLDRGQSHQGLSISSDVYILVEIGLMKSFRKLSSAHLH